MSVKPGTTPELPPTAEERDQDNRWSDYCRQSPLCCTFFNKVECPFSDSRKYPKYKLPIPPEIE